MKFLISDPCVEARGCCCCRSLTAILQPVPWDLLLAWLGKYWKTGAPNAGSLSEAGLDGAGGGVRSRQILPSNPPFTPRWTSFAFHPASMSSPSLTTQGRWNRGPGVAPVPLDLDQNWSWILDLKRLWILSWMLYFFFRFNLNILMLWVSVCPLLLNSDNVYFASSLIAKPSLHCLISPWRSFILY